MQNTPRRRALQQDVFDYTEIQDEPAVIGEPTDAAAAHADRVEAVLGDQHSYVELEVESELPLAALWDRTTY